ncbi:MAG: hypothetical protein EA367_04685 [Leptolyngbya sp. DLM2.Bin15]|nr:MAG: hypothetical protein EA367_04685 [Leptolyngbya sp. DLM2.Bin15]
MRISTAVLYTIAALAAKEALQPAIAAADPVQLKDDPDLNRADDHHQLASEGKVQAVPPQMIASQPLSLSAQPDGTMKASVAIAHPDSQAMIMDRPMEEEDRRDGSMVMDNRTILDLASSDRPDLITYALSPEPAISGDLDLITYVAAEPVIEEAAIAVDVVNPGTDELAIAEQAIAPSSAITEVNLDTALVLESAQNLRSPSPTDRLEFWQGIPEAAAMPAWADEGLDGGGVELSSEYLGEVSTAIAPPEVESGLTWAIAPQIHVPAPTAQPEEAIVPPMTAQVLAQATPSSSTLYVPDLMEVQQELQRLEELGERRGGDRWTPGLTIVNPTGYGLDNWTPFVGATFQSRTRYSNVSDGAMVFGIGAGDAREAVGVELSYTLASFGRNRDFGTGGFNLRVHRRFSEDFAGAIGWNGFLTVGDADDFESSVYGVLTKIVTLSDRIEDPFSRIAFTAGIGSGMFRSETDVDEGNDTIGAFGSMAVRLAEPVSLVTEWTGQDLAIGLSVAPFANRSIVITPALRDITGAGDGARFVLGIGASF